MNFLHLLYCKQVAGSLHTNVDTIVSVTIDFSRILLDIFFTQVFLCLIFHGKEVMLCITLELIICQKAKLTVLLKLGKSRYFLVT